MKGCDVNDVCVYASVGRASQTGLTSRTREITSQNTDLLNLFKLPDYACAGRVMTFPTYVGTLSNQPCPIVHWRGHAVFLECLQVDGVRYTRSRYCCMQASRRVDKFGLARSDVGLLFAV